MDLQKLLGGKIVLNPYGELLIINGCIPSHVVKH